MYTVYTYWNSEGVIAVLNAIVLIMGGGDYLGLMRTFAIAGMLVGVGAGLVRISAKEPLQYFVFLGLFYFGLFVPKVTVDVIDVRTGGVGTVANVPFGVAFFYSASSKVGRYLTDTFENAFQPVENLRFGKTGLAFGARAFQQVSAARVGDVRLAEGLREFTRSCINPEILESPDKYKALFESTNIWTTIGATGWLNAGRSAQIPNTTGGYDYLPCIAGTGSDAYGALTAWLLNEVPIQRNMIARLLFQDKQSPSSAWTIAEANVAQALADVEGYMLGTSRTALQQIQQGMIVNAITDSGGSLAAARNDPTAMQAALASKMAEMQANSAYRTMALIGEAALPKFRNIIEVVIISVFPIVMLLIIMAGEKGGHILKTYLVTNIWVQLWAPLYAVVNFLMIGGMSSRFQAALDGAASQTILNTAAITMTAFKEASLAGSLVFTVPVIAYALVKGGEVAMSGAMGGLTGTASGAASSAGSSVGVGNISAGNTSWGNHSSNSTSANKWDTSGSMTMGSWSTNRGGVIQSGDMGTAMGGSGFGTGRTSMAGVTSDMGGMSGYASAAFGTTAQSAMTSSLRSGSDAVSQLSNTISSGLQQSKGFSARSGSAADVAATWGTGNSTQNGSGFDKSLTDSVRYGNSAGLSSGEAVTLAAAASAGTGAFAKAVEKLAGAGNASAGIKGMAGKLAKAASVLGADLDAAFKADAGLKQTYDSARQAGDSEAFKASLGKVMSGNTGSSASRTSSAGNESSSGTTSSYQDVVAAQNTARSSFSKANDLSDTISNMRQGGGQVQVGLANMARQELGGEGFAQMFRPGNEAQAAKYLDGLAQRAVGQLGGGFTPQQGSAPQAGGAAGAQLASDAKAATAGGQPPGWKEGQVDAVQMAKEGNDKAAGPGPSSKPGTVSGAGGEKTTAAGVQKEAEKQLADADNALGKRHGRLAGNVQGVKDETQGEIAAGAKGGGLVGRAGTALVNNIPGVGTGTQGSTDVRKSPTMRIGNGPDWRNSGEGKKGR